MMLRPFANPLDLFIFIFVVTLAQDVQVIVIFFMKNGQRNTILDKKRFISMCADILLILHLGTGKLLHSGL